MIKDLDLRCLRVKIFWWEKGADGGGRFKEKAGFTAWKIIIDSINESINQKTVCLTALATSGLLNIMLCDILDTQFACNILLLQIEKLVSHKYKPEFRQIGPS